MTTTTTTDTTTTDTTTADTTMLRVEVDHGSTSAKGRRPGQVWLVRLRRGRRAVIIATGLHRPAAEHLAGQIHQLLHPGDTATGRPR